MVYPRINYFEFFIRGLMQATAFAFYAYNYPLFTYNIRYKAYRYLFPVFAGIGMFTLWR